MVVVVPGVFLQEAQEIQLELEGVVILGLGVVVMVNQLGSILFLHRVVLEVLAEVVVLVRALG